MKTDTAVSGDQEPSIGAVTSGEWVVPEVSYVDPQRRFCDLCGRPIARRYWQTVTGGERRIFCDPAHAALYTTYPMRFNNTTDHPLPSLPTQRKRQAEA